MYRATRHGERGVVLLPFLYVVFYRIIGSDVIVFGCFDASRDPHAVRDILRSRR